MVREAVTKEDETRVAFLRQPTAGTVFGLASALALSLSVSTGAVAASRPAAAKSTVTIAMWNSVVGPGAAALTKVVNQFNATHPGIVVKNTFITQSDALLSKLSTALAVGQEPTILYDDVPSNGPTEMKSGKMVNLTSWARATVDRWIYPKEIAGCMYKGVQFCIPSESGDYALYYNKTQFAQAGIKSPPKTWSQVIADGKKLTDPAKNHYGIYIPFGTTEWTVWTFEGMLWANGGQFLNANDTKAEFDSPAGVNALTIWYDCLYKYKIAPLTSFSTPTNSDGEQAFASGLVAMLIDGSWDLSTFDQAKIDYGVTYFPAIKTYATNTGQAGIDVFNTGAAQVAAAKTFLVWFLNPKVQAAMSSQVPGAMPAEPAVNNNPTFVKSEAPYMNVFLGDLTYAHVRPSIVSYPAISAALGQQIDEVLYAKETPAQALRIAAQQADQILLKNHE
jgi:ABC-type glycerol-3-phosphate transport system substrate-binding protein